MLKDLLLLFGTCHFWKVILTGTFWISPLAATICWTIWTLLSDWPWLVWICTIWGWLLGVLVAPPACYSQTTLGFRICPIRADIRQLSYIWRKIEYILCSTVSFKIKPLLLAFLKNLFRTDSFNDTDCKSLNMIARNKNY